MHLRGALTSRTCCEVSGSIARRIMEPFPASAKIGEARGTPFRWTLRRKHRMATSKTKAKAASGKMPILRFAHPFFPTTPKPDRTTVPGVGRQMLDYVQGNLQPIPAARRTPTMTLADVIGQPGSDQIAASGAISFHAVGDTGRSVNSPQGA